MIPLIEWLRKSWRPCAEPAMMVPYALRAAAASLFAILAASASQSEDYRVDRVSVLERGIFEASNHGPPIGHSRFGPVTNVRGVSLVQSTATIPARKSLRFGLRYVITGAPAGAPVEIRLVTAFQKRVCSTRLAELGITRASIPFGAQSAALPTASSGLTNHGSSSLENGSLNFGRAAEISERKGFASWILSPLRTRPPLCKWQTVRS